MVFQPSGSPSSLYEYIHSLSFFSLPSHPPPYTQKSRHSWNMTSQGWSMLHAETAYNIGYDWLHMGLLKDQRGKKKEKTCSSLSKSHSVLCTEMRTVIVLPSFSEGHPYVHSIHLCHSMFCAFVNLSWNLNSNLKQQYIMKRTLHLKSEYLGKFDTFSVRL